jgi:hypothetical protein
MVDANATLVVELRLPADVDGEVVSDWIAGQLLTRVVRGQVLDFDVIRLPEGRTWHSVRAD